MRSNSRSRKASISLSKSSSDAKQAFYRRITDDLARQADIAPANVMIVITENRDADWCFGHGEAPFLEARHTG